ncbi:hypothetical protein K7X08_029275 [Anisodus acutangulus]|uniref:Uncharacterized protein n=1 Tax=Anisodus acutangulus TaxID=402998 RepID=A0A9Q1L2Q8_9SOLA|nr:hypothetical protein K7X08_029275 [Anisodus acutangulus]
MKGIHFHPQCTSCKSCCYIYQSMASDRCATNLLHRVSSSSPVISTLKLKSFSGIYYLAVKKVSKSRWLPRFSASQVGQYLETTR